MQDRAHRARARRRLDRLVPNYGGYPNNNRPVTDLNGRTGLKAIDFEPHPQVDNGATWIAALRVDASELMPKGGLSGANGQAESIVPAPPAVQATCSAGIGPLHFSVRRSRLGYFKHLWQIPPRLF